MWQPFADYFWLSVAACLAGAINALAGGGTLLTFPALVGVLSRDFGKNAAAFANGTSTVALVPASIGSAWGFRRELWELRTLLVWLLPPSVVGGTIGSILVIKSPGVFGRLVPWLILAATTLFLLQPLLVRLKTLVAAPAPASTDGGLTGVTTTALLKMIALQFFIAIYGGYFGAGIGILMLSGLGMMGLTNIHQMNGLKTVLASAINGVSILVFVIAGNVVWAYAAAMMIASLLGGYFAAHYSRRIPGKYVRWFVIVIGFSLAGFFFLISRSA